MLLRASALCSTKAPIYGPDHEENLRGVPKIAKQVAQ